VDHEKLFDFASSFVVTERWLATHKGDLSSQSNFAENYFTTGRFSECEQLILVLLAEPKIPISEKAPLHAIRIASMLANNKADQALVELDSLIADVRNQPAGFKVTWSFEGTRHFVGQEKNLALYRDWLGQLFDALKSSNERDIMITALEKVRASFKAASFKSKVTEQDLLSEDKLLQQLTKHLRARSTRAWIARRPITLSSQQGW
jgi:hypothetical protein